MGTKRSAKHQREARPLHFLVLAIFGVAALSCIVGGILAIYQNAQSPTEFSLWGAKLTTGHVGVAFVGIGLVIAYFAARSVMHSQGKLAELPSDAPRRRSKPKRQ